MMKSLLRKNKDDIRRETSYQNMKSALEEKRGILNAEIQRLVNEGNLRSARIAAKKLARTERALEEITRNQFNLESVGERLQVARTVKDLGDEISRANEEMSQMEKVSTSSAVARLVGKFKAQGDKT